MHIQHIPASAPPPPRVWTPLELINWTKAYFERKGIESPRLEAELLLAGVLGCPRIRLYVDFEKPVPAEKLAVFREYVKRRGETREPLQYILGSAQFLDLQMKVDRNVLIPRPETECLAAWALEKARAALGPSAPPVAAEGSPPPAQESSFRVLDLCTGSGCLAIYMAAKEPRVRAVAADISADALAVAGENARAQGVDGRVVLAQGDLFDALAADDKGAFDLVLANPPYVDPAARMELQPEVREHEPAQALFADGGGTSISKRILGAAAEWLKPGGWLGLEFGAGQGKELRQLAEAAGPFTGAEIVADHARLPRFLIARRKR